MSEGNWLKLPNCILWKLTASTIHFITMTGSIFIIACLVHSLTSEYCEQNERHYILKGPTKIKRYWGGNKNEMLLKGLTKMKPYWGGNKNEALLRGQQVRGATEGPNKNIALMRWQQKWAATEGPNKNIALLRGQQKWETLLRWQQVRGATEVATSERRYWWGNKYDAWGCSISTTKGGNSIIGTRA